MVEPTWRLIEGECVAAMAAMEAGMFDAIVTDAPYGLAFMGAEWDSFGGRSNKNAVRDRAAANQGPGAGNGNQPFGFSGPSVGDCEQTRRFAEFSRQWAIAALQAVKPGGYLLAFGGTRTYHRLTCAIEDAGWEIRDCLLWLHAQGFPKGRGCLKPSYEPVVLARKPGKRVLPLNVDECRVPTEGATARPPLSTNKHDGYRRPWNEDEAARAAREARRSEAHDKRDNLGRYPANVLHDGSDEVLEAFAAFGSSKSPAKGRGRGLKGANWRGMEGRSDIAEGLVEFDCYADTGTAARFFFCAKASREERGEGNNHCCVKPLALMRWLVRLVTRHGDTVLDPFTGSGTTGVAALLEGRSFVGIEQEPAYCEIARRRLAGVDADTPLFARPSSPSAPPAAPSLFPEGEP